MEFYVGRVLEIAIVLVLSSYFPILTYSFFKYRLVRKQEELMLLLERVNMVSTFNTASLKSRMDKEYAPGDYILPVFFISALTFFGVFLLLLSWMIYDMSGGSYTSILLSGSEFWTSSEDLKIEKRSVSVMAFAIMGSYISSSRYIYRRFSTIDLTPGNYFSVGLRTVMAALVSLMLSFLFTDTELVNGNMILVIAFLTGIFPDSGLKLLLEKTKLFQKEDSGHKNYPLEYVEGISELHKIRLNEVGIDNVQNLAQFNFFMLIIKTPFPVRTLMDWTAQARLILEFQEDFKSLQKAGIRTILDFTDACDADTPEASAKRLDQIHEATGVSRLSLEINYQNVKADQAVLLLSHFRRNLEHFKMD